MSDLVVVDVRWFRFGLMVGGKWNSGVATGADRATDVSPPRRSLRGLVCAYTHCVF